MKLYSLLGAFLLLCTLGSARAQHSVLVDSLEQQLANADTLQRTELLKKLCWELRNSNPDRAYTLGLEALHTLERQGNIDAQCDLHNKLAIAKRNKGAYSQALEHLYRVLALATLPDNRLQLAYAHNNFGDIYGRLGKFDQALDNLESANELFQQQKDTLALAYNFTQRGVLLQKQTRWKQAREAFAQGLRLRQQIHMHHQVAASWKYIGDCFLEEQLPDSAYASFRQAHAVFVQLRDTSNFAGVFFGYGRYFLTKGKTALAIEYLNQGIRIAQRYDRITQLNEFYALLHSVYAQQGNYAKAYETFGLYKSLNDSLFNETNIRNITALEYTYKFEKEKHTNELAQQKKDALAQARSEQQRLFLYLLGLGFLGVFVSALVILRLYLRNRRTNRLLSEQKAHIEQKNEELTLLNEETKAQRDEISIQHAEIQQKNEYILSSIHYARRIQQASLPPASTLNELLPEHFVFYRPRDIVSGDFYLAKSLDRHVLLAVADCTGHGVPGALLSMLGIAVLNEIVRNKDISSTNAVLDELRLQIKRALQQTGSHDTSPDGLDIAFCAIDRQSMLLRFSGAHHPLWIVRAAGQGQTPELIELEPDRMPVGVYRRERPFREHLFTLLPGDMVYLFTDGYPSQLNARRDETYKIRRFRQLILQTAHLPMEEQNQRLASELNAWKANTPQNDDILVIGFRI